MAVNASAHARDRLLLGCEAAETVESVSLNTDIPLSEVANGNARKQRLKRRHECKVKEAGSIAP
jgi:hypothetical protein